MLCPSRAALAQDMLASYGEIARRGSGQFCASLRCCMRALFDLILGGTLLKRFLNDSFAHELQKAGVEVAMTPRTYKLWFYT